MNRDKILKCEICGKDFIFRADKQEFYKEKKIAVPTMCRNCIRKRKKELNNFIK